MKHKIAIVGSDKMGADSAAMGINLRRRRFVGSAVTAFAATRLTLPTVVE